MVKFRQKLMTVAMVLAVSVSVFGQKGGDNSNKQRPPKDPPQVVVKEKPPPPADKKGDKKGKP